MIASIPFTLQFERFSGLNGAGFRFEYVDQADGSSVEVRVLGTDAGLASEAVSRLLAAAAQTFTSALKEADAHRT